MIALTLRLEADVHEALRREAFDRRVSVSEIIRERIAGAAPEGEPSDAQDAVRRLKDAGVGVYMILAAVTKVYDMETKA